jgi:hypothetical protein
MFGVAIKRMLKQQRSLQVEFWAWILGLFVLILVSPILTKELWCAPSREQQWPINSDSGTAQGSDVANKIGGVVEAQRQHPNNKDRDAKTIYRKYLDKSGFCSEAKITDLALIFFTACLVIVGWFTIRSGERNSRKLERAYIFPTPGIDQTKSRDGNIFVEIMLHKLRTHSRHCRNNLWRGLSDDGTVRVSRLCTWQCENCTWHCENCRRHDWPHPQCSRSRTRNVRMSGRSRFLFFWLYYLRRSLRRSAY